MTVQDLLQGGRLAEAVAAQTAAVKAKPLDADARYLLFALLVFAGQWDRAGRQLDALGRQDPKLEAGARIYRNLLVSEAERRAVLQQGSRPLLPPDVAPHVAARLDAAMALARGDADGAARKLDEAVAAQPELHGRCNGEPFAAVRDLDDLLGSVLEIYAGGRYLWLPLEQVRLLEILPPQHVLDLIWLPAHLEDVRGADAAVHVPVLYVDTTASPDESVRLGRKTEWLDAGAGLLRGQGQRVLVHQGADGGELHETAVLSVRSLEVDA